MACRTDWIDRHNATLPGSSGAYRATRCRQPATAVDVNLAQLSQALKPLDAHAVTAAILLRLRQHDYLPPAAPVTST